MSLNVKQVIMKQEDNEDRLKEEIKNLEEEIKIDGEKLFEMRKGNRTSVFQEATLKILEQGIYAKKGNLVSLQQALSTQCIKSVEAKVQLTLLTRIYILVI